MGRWSPEARQRVRQRNREKRAKNIANAAHEINRVLKRDPQSLNGILAQIESDNPSPSWIRDYWTEIKTAAKGLGYRWFLDKDSRKGWFKGGSPRDDDLFGEKHTLKVIEAIRKNMNLRAMLPPYQTTIALNLLPPTK